MSAYKVSREGQELGSFDAAQIQEGLQTGYFQPTDWGWCEGMADWQALPQLFAQPKQTPVSSALQARPAASPQNAVGRKTAAGSLNPYAAPASNVASGSGLLGSVPVPVISELAGTKPWVRFISVLMWIGCSVMILFVVLNLVMGLMGASALAKSGNGGLGVTFMIAMTFGYGISAMLIIYPTLKLSKYASNISRLADSHSYSDLIAALREQRRFWKFYGIIILVYLSLLVLFVILMVAGVGFGSLAARG